jgi:hypothetical protein
MNNLLRSLTEKLQQGVSSRAAVPLRHDAPTGNDSTLNAELEAFEKIFAEQLAKLKAQAAIHEGIGHGNAEQDKRLLSGGMHAAAERETDRAFSPAGRKMPALADDDSLPAHDEGRTRLPEYAKQIDELQLACKEAHAEAARHAEVFDEAAQALTERIAALEGKLKAAEEEARGKALAMEQVSIAVQELKSRVGEQSAVLLRQGAEIADLKAQLTRLSPGNDAMPSETKPAPPAHSDIEATSSAPAQMEAGLSEEGTASPNEPIRAAVVPPKADGQLVSHEVIQRIAAELADAINVMENLAELLVRRHAKKLGESLDKFPLARLSELLAALATEVPDEQRADFRERLAQTTNLPSQTDTGWSK